ncbi:MAG: hypothetical protein K0S04_3765 [Herbinix sp.]|jgi:hypothetical protein|nr:hypothetical protein [Herbinix sp.]
MLNRWKRDIINGVKANDFHAIFLLKNLYENNTLESHGNIILLDFHQLLHVKEPKDEGT